jgi:hypothetical protein
LESLLADEKPNPTPQKKQKAKTESRKSEIGNKARYVGGVEIHKWTNSLAQQGNDDDDDVDGGYV